MSLGNESENLNSQNDLILNNDNAKNITTAPNANDPAAVDDVQSANTSQIPEESQAVSDDSPKSDDSRKLASADSQAASAPEQTPVQQKIQDPVAEKKLRKEASKTLAEARKLYKRAKKQLSADRQQEVENTMDSLDQALKNDQYSCASAHEEMKSVIQKRLSFARKSQIQEIFESLLIALGFALLLRTFLIEPFKIPTRSMVPTLLEGDQLFVTKLSYGIRLPFIDRYVVNFSTPERGDVVVFAFPREDAAKYLARTNSGCLAAESLVGDKDYIKRIIGIPGDTVEVIDQVVHVNGEPVTQIPFYERTVSDYMYLTDKRRESWNREQHGSHSYMTITHDQVQNNHFGPIKVLPDHVFVMGDNRDNSADSRCWGQVPMDNIKGRAQIIWWSTGHVGLRTERMFTSID